MIIITKKPQLSLYFRLLLVINKHMKLENILNHDLTTLADKNKERFITNEPFSHILLENFFKENYLREILKEFPDLEKNNGSMEFNTKSDKKKFATNVEFNYPEKISSFLSFLNSFKFLSFLQKLTGIKESLVPDPYFFGGGLHQIKRGGFLKVHADFNYHPQMKLDRRLNLLIYLNEDWQDEWGGFLELWDKDMKKCVKKILPLFNTMVIFSTNDFTNHGHPNPLKCPKDISRKSIATYYFSKGRPISEVIKVKKKNTTFFKNRHGEKNDVYVKKEFFRNILRNFVFYQNMKNLEKKYLRTGKSKKKRKN